VNVASLDHLAAGELRSVYVRDPDGNLVELSNVR